ncbi:uncharacterized protein TNCV_2926541 [Trichonephila clavipes]|nr:uncharacterized protein TNCV_2926541 [Trichonephila clavipes]
MASLSPNLIPTKHIWNGIDCCLRAKLPLRSKNELRRERAEVDMSLRRFRRQYEQLSQFERGRIIGMLEDGWSARRVARQLGRSDCVVRRCWYQWIREMPFTRRPGSGCPRQTSRR